MLSIGPAHAQMEDPPLVSTPHSDPLDGVGLIDAARGGLPGWLWRGISIGRARPLILDLPAAPQSRVLRDLQFRLLTSSTRPPSPDGSSGANLLTLRVERLAAMAEAESAHEMLRLAEGKEDAATARLVTESLMRVGQRDSACARVTETGERYKDVWWRQAAIVCDFHARQNDAARSRLEKLRSEPDVDPTFIALAGGVLGGTAPGAAPYFTEDGLTLALLDLAKIPVPVTATDTPGVLRAIIENKAVPLERRIEIAERAERAGAIEPSRLADFYEELSRRLKDSAATSPIDWRAVIFAQAQRAATNEQRIVIAQRLYEVSRDTADSAIRALSEPIAAARPTPSHADFAVSGFRAALVLERFDRASEWLAAVQSGNEALVADRLALLAPLAAIAHLPDRPLLDRKMMERRAALRPQTAAALYAVLMALEAAPREELAPLAPKQTRNPPDPASAALIAAADAGRFGETICRAASLAGNTPVTALDLNKVVAILYALLQVNRRDAARSFALEYALLAGL